MSVYKAISAVMLDLSKEGISKDRKNESQGYKFRGIDDVYNALSSALSKHHLVCLPRVLAREVVERTTAKGTVLFYVTVDVEYDLVAEDGSKHTVKTYGEAMDSGDKATNKAMSAAFKYMAMQVFCIPTEGDNDADAQTHEVKPSGRKPNPATFREWNALNGDQKIALTDMVTAIGDALEVKDDFEAAHLFYERIGATAELDANEAMMAVWSCFNSAERSRITAANAFIKSQKVA